MKTAIMAAAFAAAAARFLSAQIMINEVQAANAQTIRAPGASDYADWIELRNEGPAAVDMGGWFLSDKKAESRRWAVPKGTVIPAKGYLVLWCDGSAGGTGAPFALSDEGEKLWLFSPDGAVADKIEFPAMRADDSFGRPSDGGQALELLATPTPGARNAPAASGYAPEPSFSPAGGFYKADTAVALSCPLAGAVLRYTLDGSEPTESSPVYKGPITARKTTRVTQKYGDGRKDKTGIQSYKYPATLSYPADRYVGDREYGFVIRAKAFAKGRRPSFSAASTYFIGMRKPSLPVIALSTDPKGFFGAREGIYVQGTNGSPTSFEGMFLVANWNRDWERVAAFEYFDEDGEKRLSRNVGVKVMGGVNRNFDMKSLNVHARDRYGPGGLAYPFFGASGLPGYGSVVLRNSGNDWEGGNYARDAAIQSVVRGAVDLETQAYKPAVLYLNGEYWGLTNIRERHDGDTLLARHRAKSPGSPAEGVDVIEYDHKSGGFIAVEGSDDFFREMMAYLDANPLSNRKKYEAFAQRFMDTDNAASYMIAQLFCQNSDWPGNNLKLWRPRIEGGRFRFLLYDTDFGYGLWGGGPDKDPFENLWRAQAEPKRIFMALLENADFKADFVQRFALMLDTVYVPSRLGSILDGIESRIASERDIWFRAEWARNSWPQYGSAAMLAWAKARVPNMRSFIGQEFGIRDWPGLKVSYDSAKGRVELCGLTLRAGREGAQCAGLPLRLKAIPAQGYVFSGWRIGARKLSSQPEYRMKFSKRTELEAVFLPERR